MRALGMIFGLRCLCFLVGSCHKYTDMLFHAWQYYYNYYYNRFTTLCLELFRWVSIRRINCSGFCWSRHEGVAVASAEPYASYLHFAAEDNRASTSSVRFLRIGCPFWHPTNQRQSTEGQPCMRIHVNKAFFCQSSVSCEITGPVLYCYVVCGIQSGQRLSASRKPGMSSFIWQCCSAGKHDWNTVSVDSRPPEARGLCFCSVLYFFMDGLCHQSGVYGGPLWQFGV